MHTSNGTKISNHQSLSLMQIKSLSLLDKNPGLGPIDVGEVLKRIAGKVIVSVFKNSVIDCTGSLQVCVGQEAGIEAFIQLIVQR